MKALFDQRFERERLAILVNNAGVSHIGTVESTTEEDFDRVLRVNLKGFYNCMQAGVGHMKSKGGGVILNMASIAGSAGLPDRFAYSMSKGAVIAMTYSVARDYLSAPRTSRPLRAPRPPQRGNDWAGEAFLLLYPRCLHQKQLALMQSQKRF